MNETLFSDLWFRIAETRPHLRPEVHVQRQLVRGERMYLLVNAANGRNFRVNREAYEFIGRCDGQRTVQAIWDALLEQLRDAAPTQDEVLQTLTELERQDLLAHDGAVDARALVRRRDERAKQKAQGFVNPLALRVPLGDPSAWLPRLDRVAKLVFSPAMFWLWLIAVGAAATVAASHWHVLSAHAGYMGTPGHLLLAWVAFPLAKALHELAHALAVRRWGGEVHEVGFTLFVLVPAPYVDASAAAAFPYRHQRFMVAAAGIMVELTLAALALMVWLNVQPGLLRDFAFVTMVIASVSTVMFNGNPLLRFDAYFILCDALDLPNLSTRSKAWWRSAIVRAMGGTPATNPMQLSSGEGKWLVLYAPLSLAMQLTLFSVIVLWLGTHSTLLATLAGLVLGGLLVLKPLALAARDAWLLAAGASRLRATAVAMAAFGAALIMLCVVPLPYSTIASGVVWSPDHARVRPGTDGFVAQVLARDGDWVKAGQVLLVLEDPALLTAREKLTNRLDQLQAGRYSAMLQSSDQARHAEEEIARTEAELQRTEQRIAQLEVRAQAAGALAMPYQKDLPGTFVRQGSTIAYVLERAEIGVRAAVPEYDAALVREGTRSVAVSITGAGEPLAAELVRDIPAATFDLPSPALGDRGGGPHATDPADKDGLRTRQPVVVVDLKVPATLLERVGGTAWVRFDHGPQPLAQRWYRQIRQVFLQHLNPTG